MEKGAIFCNFYLPALEQTATLSLQPRGPSSTEACLCGGHLGRWITEKEDKSNII